MVILSNDGRTIEFSINNRVNLTEDRRKYAVKIPEITCTSKTDAETMQKKINTFIYNYVHELLSLDKRLTVEEARLAEEKEEKTNKKKENINEN